MEFKQDTMLSRAHLDLLDSYFEHRRWYKQKSKALIRDLEREKNELKERTVKMIDEEVSE